MRLLVGEHTDPEQVEAALTLGEVREFLKVEFKPCLNVKPHSFDSYMIDLNLRSPARIIAISTQDGRPLASEEAVLNATIRIGTSPSAERCGAKQSLKAGINCHQIP